MPATCARAICYVPMGAPQPTSLSPFYLYTLLRVLLGVGLMQSALHAGAVFQVQRTVLGMSAQCVGGQLVAVPQAGHETTIEPMLPPSFPVLSPGTSREWCAVQLQWVCSVLCYVAVVVSIVSERLRDVLEALYGASVAEMFNIQQNRMRCAESVVTVLSLVVYVVNKAYDLWLQYYLSQPVGGETTTWDAKGLLVVETVVVVLVGVAAIGKPLVDYFRLVRVGSARALL